MLYRFGQTRNGYVATYFIFLSSTAASSATSGYVVVPEHFGQNEEPDGSKTRKKPKFVPQVGFFDAIVFPSMWLCFFEIVLLYFIYFLCIFFYFPPMENRFDRFLFMLFFIVSAQEQALWYPFATD